MNLNQGWKLRLAVLSTLIKDAPAKPGRTMLMKLAYLLQIVKGVPLGYRFELYNYGPYDPTLLSDLSHAVTLKAVRSETVRFQSGYRYEYTTNGKGHDALCREAADSLTRYTPDLNWALEKFGNESASRLELITTIIFAEREMQRKRQQRLYDELCKRVKRIKPHFTDETIAGTVDELATAELIAIDAD